MDPADELVAAVRAHTEGTPYVVEPTAAGFDVRIDIANAEWYGLMDKQHLSRTWIYHVKLDAAEKAMSITDDERTVEWTAGVPKLGASLERKAGRIQEKSFQKTFAFNAEGEYGKVVDYTFDASEGRDLIRGPARELGWSEEMGSAQRIGLVVGIIGAAGAVLTVIVLVVAALLGAF